MEQSLRKQGAQKDWEELVSYAQNHNLANQTYFDHVASKVDIDNMKKDLEKNDFVTYTGEYSIDSTYHFTFSVSELWFDLRAVTTANDDEPLWFDLMSDIDTDLVGNGTIIYGKNSRYVVLIDSE